MKDIIQKLRDKFILRMSKEKSVERAVVILLRPRRSWENGLSSDKLLELVNKEKRKKYKKNRVYEAISLINRFGVTDWGIYIISRHGWVDTDNNKNIEYRYFNVKEPNETRREFDKLDYKKDIINIKEDNVNYHESKTILQESQLETLRQNE